MDQVHNEEWRKLPETIYSVSSNGQFRNDNNGYIKKQTPTKDGYLTVNIQGKTFQSHRLVAKCFLDDFSEKKVVNHKDFNRKNNAMYNLNMCTIKENAQHSAKVGRYRRFGELNNNCKVSTETVLMINTYLESGLNCAEISRKTDICRRYINDIKLKKKRVLWKD
jgi:hypothetical protein